MGFSTPDLSQNFHISRETSLKTIKSVAATGVDRISIGSITHSAPAVDFKLEI